ncbi:hypothetical protein MMC18_002203 [Xylographa bjoerkii]|nr:hypothetical protein [Xylographa bjoerkii]
MPSLCFWQSVPNSAAKFSPVDGLNSDFQNDLRIYGSRIGFMLCLYQFQGEEEPSEMTREEILRAFTTKKPSLLIGSHMTQSRKILLFEKRTVDEWITYQGGFLATFETSERFRRSIVWQCNVYFKRGLFVSPQDLITGQSQVAPEKSEKKCYQEMRQAVPRTDTEDVQPRPPLSEPVSGRTRSDLDRETTVNADVSNNHLAFDKATVLRWLTTAPDFTSRHVRRKSTEKPAPVLHPQHDTLGSSLRDLARVESHQTKINHMKEGEEVLLQAKQWQLDADAVEGAIEAEAGESPADFQEINSATDFSIILSHTFGDVLKAAFEVLGTGAVSFWKLF